jgi:hypothetical protein
MDWNNSNVIPNVPAEYASDWVTYDQLFPGYANGEWITVNPFANDILILRDRDRNLIQPRWVSVEVGVWQAKGETVWIDNVILTSKCIPEPMSLILGCIGLSSVAGLRRLRRK